MLTGKLANGAGKKTCLVTIQRARDGVPNADYDVPPAFNPLCPALYAEIVPQGGREFVSAMQVWGKIEGIAKVGYDSLTSTISTRDRIVIGDRILNIVSVYNENETNEKIVITYVEIAS